MNLSLGLEVIMIAKSEKKQSISFRKKLLLKSNYYVLLKATIVC